MHKYIYSTLIAFALSVPAFAQGITEKLSDAQIATVLLHANEGEAKLGKLASKQASGKQVKEFAQQMVSDHTAANRELKAINSKLRIKKAESDVTANLSATASASEIRIKSLKGLEFDKAYIDDQVTLHQIVLDTIDQRLLPDAQGPDFKAYLEKIRPIVAKHLDHAKSLQTAVTAGR